MITRMIVTDMDDTLIKAYGEPTPATRDFWNSLNGKVIRVIATGQSVAKTCTNLSKFGMELPEFVIADQGTVIFDTKTGKTIKEFVLPNEEVYEVYKKFLLLGGKNQFARISSGKFIIAYDCELAHKFFEKTFQKDVLYVNNIDYVIKYGKYLKVIFMNEENPTNELVKLSSSMNNLFSYNTGKTSFGECGYHRFEVIASDKYNAIQYLMKTLGLEAIDVIGLGDEASDLGLAKFAFTMNLVDDNQGLFAIIGSNTNGNKLLRTDSMGIAAALGCIDKCKVYPNVDEDGWKKAVEEWL